MQTVNLYYSYIGVYHVCVTCIDSELFPNIRDRCIYASCNFKLGDVTFNNVIAWELGSAPAERARQGEVGGYI